MLKTEKYILRLIVVFGIIFQFLSCATNSKDLEQSEIFKKMTEFKLDSLQHNDTVWFGAGCFWCTEAQFSQLEGVVQVLPGYMGGTVKHPTYQQVCAGNTGHVEVCEIVYNPKIISFDELLAAFFMSHDPTQLNRQGNDIGLQYRSVIFFHSTLQADKSKHYIDALNKEKAYPMPIVTKVEKAQTFYPAEDYHKNYYELNTTQPYCQYIIGPKLDKFKKVFKDKLKPQISKP